MKNVDIVIPAFNEEGNITLLCERIFAATPKGFRFKLIFVNDGSSDRTQEVISQLSRKNPNIKYISFSRNFGHQIALKAGLDHSSGDCAISLDADLQHPPELIPELLRHWTEGYAIVYTRRNDTKNVSSFKRLTARLFYSLLRSVSGLNIDQGAADFRLLDKKVVNVLREFREQNLFIRGMISNIGFNLKAVDYEPEARFSGQSKYTFKKMFLFALDGITSFSIKPLHIATLAGFFFSFLAGVYALYALYQYFIAHKVISGWTSVVVSVLFIGGVQLIVLGILGEYLGKMFLETKNRPGYIIGETNVKKRI